MFLTPKKKICYNYQTLKFCLLVFETRVLRKQPLYLSLPLYEVVVRSANILSFPTPLVGFHWYVVIVVVVAAGPVIYKVGGR